MTTLSIYVTSSGDLFREGFNAVAALVGTSTFESAMRLSLLFSVIGVGMQYIKTKDIGAIGKWFILYFSVTGLLVIPKVSVQIIDVSQPQPGSSYHVDHVPFGLAFPASLISTVGYQLERVVELTFAMPDDATYSKTGLLFGSQLFRLSTGFHFIDPQVRSDFNAYFKNCVRSDIQISHQYTVSDLVSSQNLWSTITQNPSPLWRAPLHTGTVTCRDATPILKQEIQDDVEQNAKSFFGKLLFVGSSDSKDDTEQAKTLIDTYLPTAYNYYINISKTATEIMTQNMIMNGIRDGVIGYDAETNATGAMLNIASTQALEKTRVAWAVSHDLATTVLPIMQTVLFLLYVGLFPMIVLLALQAGLTFTIIKSYLFGLLWLEAWPFCFAILNLAVTFYLHPKSNSLANSGFTLLNVDRLNLMHSDIAGMAGYLMMAIPFILKGAITGLATTFTQASQYIGGMMHSTAQNEGASVVSGNLSYGNVNYANASANKINTNTSYQHGLNTQQLDNGTLRTTTESGGVVYDNTPAMSRLQTSMHAGSMMSEQLSKSADHTETAATQDQSSLASSLSHASHALESYSHSDGMNRAAQHNYSVNKNTTVEQATSNLASLTKDFMARNGGHFNETFQGATRVSESLEGHASFEGNRTFIGKVATLATGANIGGSVRGGVEHGRTTNTSTGHDRGVQITASSGELKQFRENMALVKSYTDHQHQDFGKNESDSLVSQFSHDLRQAESSQKSFSANLNKAKSYREMANYAQTHSANINSDCIQAFVSELQQRSPDTLESAVKDVAHPERLASMAEHFIKNQYLSTFMANYRKTADTMRPESYYQDVKKSMSQENAHIRSHYASGKQVVDAQYHRIHPDWEKEIPVALRSKVFAHQVKQTENIVSQKKEIQDQAQHREIITQTGIDQANERVNKEPLTHNKVWGSIEPKATLKTIDKEAHKNDSS